MLEEPEPIPKYDYLAHNCLAYARTKVKGLPTGLFDAKYLVTLPKKTPIEGGIVLQKYKQKDGTWLHHVSVIEELREDGIWVSESNFKKGEYGKRLIPYDSPSIVLFWNP